MKVVIIAAMDREYESLCNLLGGERGGRGGHEFILVQGGIGKVNAACTCTELILREHPDCIISSGCAGGLRPDIKVMDTVVGSQYCYHDVWCGEPNAVGQVQGHPARFDADPSLIALARTVGNGRGDTHKGLICSGDRFCTDQEEISAIAGAFPQALAVDMESCAMAQVCHLYDVPFLSVRVISDSVSADGRKGEYDNFWAEVSDSSFGFVSRLLDSLPSQIR